MLNEGNVRKACSVRGSPGSGFVPLSWVGRPETSLSAGGKERLTLTRGDAAFGRVPSKPTPVVWAFSGRVDPQVTAGHGLASCLYSSQVCSHLPAVCEPHSLHPPRSLNALLLPGTPPCACSRLCHLCRWAPFHTRNSPVRHLCVLRAQPVAGTLIYPVDSHGVTTVSQALCQTFTISRQTTVT